MTIGIIGAGLLGVGVAEQPVCRGHLFDVLRRLVAVCSPMHRL
jgi:hypothetical protein